MGDKKQKKPAGMKSKNTHRKDDKPWKKDQSERLLDIRPNCTKPIRSFLSIYEDEIVAEFGQDRFDSMMGRAPSHVELIEVLCFVRDL